MLIAQFFIWNPEVGFGELLVGVATLALAGTTAWLAMRTSADVKLSAQSLEISREAMEEQAKPFLVGAPDQPSFDMSPTFENGDKTQVSDLKWLFYLDIENFGRGPAILDGLELLNSEGEDLVKIDWKVETIFAPDSGPKASAVDLAGELPPEGATLGLRLFYRSPSGVRYETHHGIEVRKQPQRAVRLTFRQERIS